LLEKEGMDWARAFATVVRAAIALQRGSRAGALGGLDSAAEQFGAVDMVAYAAATRDRAARLRDDASAKEAVARASEFFRGEDVTAPERMIPTLVPGFAA